MDRFTQSLYALQREAQRWIKDDCGGSLYLDEWESPLGCGVTGFCSSGLLEKAGVNVSEVSGQRLPLAASSHRAQYANNPFKVQGLSMIFHPENPHIPTAHLNIRRFEVFTPQGREVWFGGGFDFSPYFMSDETAMQLHDRIADYLGQYDSSLYSDWSQQCDNYFYLPHRKEYRGIGGIFFDDYLYQSSEEKTESFLIDQVSFFYNLYRGLINKADNSYSKRQRDFQLWRRGRYVEFNLLYDRGTRFGLESGGRVESILISLPPLTAWAYQGDKQFSDEMQQWRKMIENTNNHKLLIRNKIPKNLEVF